MSGVCFSESKTPKNLTLSKGEKKGELKGEKRKLLKTSPFKSKVYEWLVTGKGEKFKTKTPKYVVKENGHNVDHNIDHIPKLQNMWSNKGKGYGVSEILIKERGVFKRKLRKMSPFQKVT